MKFSFIYLFLLLSSMSCKNISDINNLTNKKATFIRIAKLIRLGNTEKIKMYMIYGIPSQSSMFIHDLKVGNSMLEHNNIDFIPDSIYVDETLGNNLANTHVVYLSMNVYENGEYQGKISMCFLKEEPSRIVDLFIENEHLNTIIDTKGMFK